MNTPLDRLRQNLGQLADQLQELKTEVLKNGFKDQAAEIHFFKQTKPSLYARQIYEADLFAIETNCPQGTPEMRRAYYEQELLYVFRTFRVHAFHYQYYKTKATILDHEYFTRAGQPSDIPTLAIEIDPQFSTPLDYLFAKFIAAEQIQDHLLDQLSRSLKPLKPEAQLRWTGEAINLAELAYAIWLTGQVDHGNATISDISRHLEQAFDIHIGTPGKKWDQIAARKHLQPTKYLDQMRQALHDRIDHDLAIPKRKARRI